MLNSLLIIVSLVVMVIFVFGMYQKAKLNKVIVVEDEYDTIDKVLEAVKLEMVEIIKEDYSLGLSDSEFNALFKRKAKINDALKNCVFGIDQAKVTVIELIRNFIADNVPIEKVSDLLGLSEGMEPSEHIKFEIMMYKYKKRYKKDALTEWIEKYNFANERLASDALSKHDKAYYVTSEDLNMAYDNESIYLKDREKFDILAVLVYQQYKGFGILDTLREMNINGFNCGTSGSILSNVTKQSEGGFRATNSVWVYYRGKYIHFRFMSFGVEDEVKRVVQLLVRYGNPGPLTSKRGYLVNTMYDKSRILALRPPASEYWAVFVRKFSLSDVSPEALIVKDFTKRGDIPVKLIELLMRGMVTCGFTGRQGSGKTTLMSSVVRFIDPRYTIRVLEMAPELYLRELYPTRNILSVQETTTVSAAELQDALKKSDAAVSMAGEVATDTVAARMIQLGQVASLFTIFSHHANTAADLVYALRNSLVNAGGFSDMTTAERQVTDVVKVDVHLDYTPDGKRYIERISEIIPLSENVPYPSIDNSNIDESMANVTREYYTRKTDRISFITRDIIRYDIKTHTYKTVNRFSRDLEARIRTNLGEMVDMFDDFTFKEWGIRKDLEDGEEDLVAKSFLSRYEKVQGDVFNTNDGIFDISSLIVEDDNTEVEVSSIINGVEPISTEDIEDVEVFFDFFDGGANV